jgi:hypothetical protein
MQITKQINNCIHILVLCEKECSDKLLMIEWDSANRKVIPIFKDDLSTIIYAIKKIPFPIEYQQTINDFKKTDIEIMSSIQFVQLTDAVMIAVQFHPSNLDKCDSTVEVEMLENVRLTPKLFTYAAFDGISSYLYYELDRADADKIKNWGLLSPIRIYINNTFYGEYFAQENHVVSDQRITFLCQQKTAAALGSHRMGKMRIEGGNVYEISDFVVSSAGLYNVTVKPRVTPSMA